VQFWPLTEEDAQPNNDTTILSGEYVRQWSLIANRMASAQCNTFTGRLTISSFWSDFNTRPMDVFDLIAPTPILWVMCTNDVVCGSLEFTKGVFEKLEGPKQIEVLDGEHLPQYFEPGLGRSVEAMVAFLRRFTEGPGQGVTEKLGKLEV
jgi:uncharacterized protein